MTAGVVALAGVVVFDFDPVGTILGVAVRWQFAAVAAIIFVALLLAGVVATVAERRRRARLAADPERPAAVAEAVRAAEETVRSTAPAAPAAGMPEHAPDALPADTGEAPRAEDEAPTAEGAAPAAEDPVPPPPVSADPSAAPPVDPAFTGWTPGHTVPHPAVGAGALAVAVPTVSMPIATEEPEPAPPEDPIAAADSTVAPAGAPPADDDRPWPVGLRLDDLLFIVAGATAGAVVFARLGWVLLYLDWYRAHTDSILDPSVGGLTLAGGVVGGILAGLLMALVLGAPVARWLGVAVVPLLAALAAGKLAMVLGGAGQGLPYDGPWATAFAGPGPWGSLAPMIPSYPAQIYEAATSAVALVAVLVLALVPGVRRHPAAAFAIGVGLWAIGRFGVASLWRDPTLIVGMNGDQLVTLGIAATAAVALLAIAMRSRRARRASGAPA